nr:uncharacterized protein LOC111996137 isoform X3 [Quercus suber]
MMKINNVVFTSLCFLFLVVVLLLQNPTRVSAKEPKQASTPPRGWNSYDSFSWTISQEEFLQNAEIISERLLPHKYKYVVVDYLWYRRKVKGAYTDSLGFDVIDEWGRMAPDPKRWPSSKGGKGFTKVAKKVHDMGLKFGIHVMRGISTQAVNANTPILDINTGRAYEEFGRKWNAKDIGIKERACAWMPHGFMSVDTKLGAGRAFLRSLYEQYAEWGVDFVKHDCVFGDDLDINEITYVSEVLKQLDRPMLYSLSPGTGVTPSMAKDVSELVNMYRITGDDWDTWADVVAHFNITRDFSTANMIGAKGLMGKSWPDLDMLPLGWLTDPGSNEGPHRTSRLLPDEQRTQFPYITSTKNFKSLDSQSGRYLTDVSTSDTHVLSLTSCTNSKAIGWSIKALYQDLEQICWKEHLVSKHQKPLCIYKKEPQFSSDEWMSHKQQYQGKLQLFATDRMDFCLGGSPNQKLTSKELKSGAFVPCRWHTNQMWELSVNGTLANSYSGLCATVNSIKAEVRPGGTRSWIATGRKGEIYVAFFNLNPERTVISAKISDMAKVLPGKNFNGNSCQCKEVWSGKDIRVRKQTISRGVKARGCALFVLKCK